MSIVTKTGDQGMTSLMFNRRVSKCDPRVEAYGCVDELSSLLGLARAAHGPTLVQQLVRQVQSHLILLMGELATTEEDLRHFEQGGFTRVHSALIDWLEEQVALIEPQLGKFKGWAIPGQDLCSSALEVARTVCRRAERRVCALREARQLSNEAILVYLNRLSDLLWLLARWVEGHSATSPPPAS